MSPALRLSAWRSRAITLVTAIVLLLAWELFVRLAGIKPIVLPAPSVIWGEFASTPQWYLLQAWYTLLMTLGGFLTAVIVGVAIAVLIVESKLLENTKFTLIVGVNSVPKVAVAPLFVIWLGTGNQPKIAISFLIALFPITIDSVLGLKSVPQDILDVAKSLRGGRFATLWRIRFPSALPSIFAGMKVGISLALVGAIVGEFVSSNRGLGYVILSAQGMFDTPRAFAAIMVLAVESILLFYAVVWIERFALPWHASQHSHG
jgi:NitT/TauT family transport system permease protein